MPGLGVLLHKNNLLGIKFDELLSKCIQKVPQNLLEVKKNVSLAVDFSSRQGPKGKSVIPNLSKSLASFRPQTTVITKLTLDGDRWLKDNLGIDVDNIQDDEESKVSDFTGKGFLNDKPKIVLPPSKSLIDLHINISTLENIYFHKNVILSEIKKKVIC